MVSNTPARTLATTDSPAVDNAFTVTLCLGALGAFAPFATDMYLSGFPDIAHSLDSTVGHVQLSISTFFFGLAIGQLLYGPIIDRFGRRIPLLAGVSLFTLASLLLTFASDMQSFLGLRFLQAIGGCAGMIVGRAIIQDIHAPREAARALSLMMIVQGIAPILAPVLGGYLVISSGWRSVFVFLTLLAMGCLAMTLRSLPETLPQHRRRRHSASEIGRIFLSFLRRPEFMIPTLVGALLMSNMFSFIAGSPFVFMDLYGVPQQWYGWLFALNATGMLMMGQVNRMLLVRYTAGHILFVALLMSWLAAIVLVFMTGTDSLWQLVIPLFLSLSVGPLIMANSVAIAMSVSGENSGSASSVIGIVQFAFAGMVTFLISVLHNGTAYPMTVYILLGSTLALALMVYGRQKLPVSAEF